MAEELESLRYPVGRFQRPTAPLTPDDRAEAVEAIAVTPARLRAAVAGLNATQLSTPYRPGGWTVRQVVHHVPDSHLNAYVRFKWTLTEDRPTIKTYLEAKWAELPDGRLDVGVSLDLLDALHGRWVALLRALGPDDWARELVHPEIGVVSLDVMLALYHWHGRHHVAHVASLRERQGW